MSEKLIMSMPSIYYVPIANGGLCGSNQADQAAGGSKKLLKDMVPLPSSAGSACTRLILKNNIISAGLLFLLPSDGSPLEEFVLLTISIQL